jgi:hypothetical protein
VAIYRCLILFLLSCNICFSQADIGGKYDSLTQAIFYGNRLSTHPFGVLTSRINHSFQTGPPEGISLGLHISSGNVWLPEVRAYEPLSQEDRNLLSNYLWNDREFHFQESSMPANTMVFHADGVIRLYQMDLRIPLREKHELTINTRAFSLDGGRVPSSLLTSDQFIEWFHSYVAGGEDPFARKVYGLDDARIQYKDARDEVWEMSKGDFILSGFDLAYFYYPQFKDLQRMGLYARFGGQLGVNVSKANPSVDLGLNSSLVKILEFKNETELRFGLSLSATHLKLLRLGEGIELSNRSLLVGSEFLINYIIPTRNNAYFSLAASYNVHSSYFKSSDFEYIVLSGERISSHWHYSISHLYKVLSAGYLIFSYSHGILAYSLFLREDFSVDNAPDIQVGLGIRLNL